MDKILKTEKLGYYEIRTVERDGTTQGTANYIEVAAYTPTGVYIGNPELAHWLTQELGITEMRKIAPSDNRVSIGVGKDGKWYGWTPWGKVRGFEVGDEVTYEDYDLTSYLSVGFEAETEDDARRMAVAHARSGG